MNNPARRRDSLFARLFRLLHVVEDSFLIFILFAMIMLGIWQIVARNFFDAGFLWADPLLRVMVLWLGLLGALVASRSDKHIAVDVLLRLSPLPWRRWIRLLTSLFTATVCAVIAFYAAQLVIDEYQYAAPAFAAIPVWILQSIIPFAFALIALRYLLLAGELLLTGEQGQAAA